MARREAHALCICHGGAILSTRSSESLASLLLVQRVAPAPVDPLKPRAFWALATRTSSLGALLGKTASQSEAELGLEASLSEQVAGRLGVSSQLGPSLEELAERGISAVTGVDESYPSRLRDRLHDGAPPVLYVAGDAALLAEPMLGIVGSRNVDEEGADVARAAARAAVRHRHGVASGGAKGVRSEEQQSELQS